MTRAAVGAACAVAPAEQLRKVLAAQRATHSRREVSEQPWRQLPGTRLAAAATRGVIRAGYPVAGC
jgi:hypothetical protein